MRFDADVLLQAWSRWRSVADAGGGGYVQVRYEANYGGQQGSCSGFAPAGADGVIVVTGKDGRPIAVDYADARNVDAVVSSVVSLSTRQMVWIWYMGRLVLANRETLRTVEQKAKAAGCCVKSLYNRIDRARVDFGLRYSEVIEGRIQRGVLVRNQSSVAVNDFHC